MKNYFQKALLAGAASLFFANAAWADAETEALRAQIKLLEARLDQLEKREAARNAEKPAVQSTPASNMENRVAILERKQEISEEDAKTKASNTPVVKMGKDGFAVTSADKQFGLKLNGYMQVDNRTFFTGGGKGDDELLARRLRPTIQIQAFKDFSFRLMPDFAGSSTRVFDAHADYKYSDALQFRVGKFKPPVSLERLQSAADIAFAERGHPNNLAPARDFGVMVYGEAIPELEYQLGMFNGNADLANTDTDDDNHKDVAARLFSQPFKTSNMLALQGLGVGIGGSYGNRIGNATTTQLGDYRTPGQKAFFAYSTNTYADGVHWRAQPQMYYYYNNIGMMAEYAISSQEVRLGNASDRLQHTAWQLVASYMLTGEDINFKGPVKPEKKFNPAGNEWGAFEVAARVGETDIDNDAFTSFASATTAASRARSYGGGINWFLNENVNLLLDYNYTNFDGGAASGADRESEQVSVLRTQFRF